MKIADTKILRFGPLIRVSSEPQARKKTSLETQAKQIQSAIDSMRGGVFKWYSGQEHATADHERQILNQLIEDAKNKCFDAIMVADVSRWSRDNEKSKQYLKIMREHGIKFFCLGMEYDLYNPESFSLLSLGVEISELYASQFAYKVLLNKIERAKRGIPSACGKVPFGRFFDRERLKKFPDSDPKTLWKVDLEKKALVQNMAKKYLHHASYEDLSKEFHLPMISIWKIFQQTGDKLTLHFHSKRFNINADIDIWIPPLLDAETISKIGKKSEGRRVWDHKNLKHRYLFSRMVFDEETGKPLSGTTSGSLQYYRLIRPKEKQYLVPAEMLDETIFQKLLETVLDEQSIKKAVFGDGDETEHMKGLKENLSVIEAQLKSIQRRKANIIASIEGFEGEGMANFLDSMKEKVQSIENSESELLNRKKLIESQISFALTPEKLGKAHQLVMKLFKMIKLDWDYEKDDYEQIPFVKLQRVLKDYGKVPFEKKREMLEMIIGGKDDKGKRYGIYITRNKSQFDFQVYGRLEGSKQHLSAGLVE